MKLTRDMAIFDNNLPINVKLMGYALGFTLTIAVHIDRVISAFISFTSYYNPRSWGRIARLEPNRLTHRK